LYLNGFEFWHHFGCDMVYNAELAKTISYFSAHTSQKFHTNSSVKGKGKGFPYSTPSVGPGADPGRLPLLSARPAVTSPAAEHHRPLAGNKSYCLLTEAHGCKQLAQVVTRRCLEQDLNPRPTDHKSNALPLHHRVT